MAMAVSSAVLAGCGGGDQLTQRELVTQADAICSKAGGEVRDVRRPHQPGQPASAYFDKVVPIARRQVDELDDLEPPARLRPRYERFLVEQKQGVELLADLRDAAQGDDRPRAQSLLARLTRASRESNAAARRVGLTVCAR